jgi:hypothetical protein
LWPNSTLWWVGTCLNVFVKTGWKDYGRKFTFINFALTIIDTYSCLIHFNALSRAANFAKKILNLTVCRTVNILTNRRVKWSNLGRSRPICNILYTCEEHAALVLSSVSVETLSNSHFLHHVEDLKPGEGTRGVEVMAPCSVNSCNKLPHVGCEVVFRRHFRSHADTGVPAKKLTIIPDYVPVKLNCSGNCMYQLL